MIAQDLAESRAEKHCARLHPANQLSFLLAFARARDDVASGADTDGRWMRMWERHERACTLAGYLEGLVSTRTADRADRRAQEVTHDHRSA
ncbi:hypothetical protein AABB02_33725 [Streptomyces rimosus]|uniref:hypothetical protein n=1 Tax=Streptomyces rimosus TaxID=1927 RepID=UPI0031E21DAE